MLEKHLRLPAVMDATGLSLSSIYEMMKTGKFPSSVYIGRRAVAWPESAIAAWLAARVHKIAA